MRKGSIMGEIRVSFVIPCYRSENTVLAVVEEIEETMRGHSADAFEIILVNDGSPDGVWQVIRRRACEDGHVTGVDLAKNFGQHCALMAGYHQARGDYIVSLDDDGQTPADRVFELLEALDRGYDVAFASYEEQHRNLIRRWGSDFAHKMTHYMLNVREDFPKGSSFFAMKRFVRDEIIRYEHPYPYIAGLLFRTTRNITMIPMHHRNRLSGASGYSMKKLISLWMNGFTAFSVKPLELGALIGFLFAVFGFLFALFVIIRKIIRPEIQAGWSSTLSAIMIVGGIIMILLGLIGEYVGRIYICLNKSPQFVVKEITGEKEERNDHETR